MGDDLVQRLRERAEGEREIQRNNQAVADALKGQRILFEERDGSANSFAVRLGLQHANCAKNDAALARDWDEAADRIEALTAERDTARASLASAQERIAALEAGPQVDDAMVERAARVIVAETACDPDKQVVLIQTAPEGGSVQIVKGPFWTEKASLARRILTAAINPTN